MSTGWRPQPTSAAVTGFKIWFGGIFLAIGLVALLVSIVLLLVLPSATGLGNVVWAFVAPPLGLGIAFSALGGTFCLLGLSQQRKDARLAQFGTTTEATVTAVEPTGTRVSRRHLWHVRFTYEDLTGAAHQGESGYLSRDDAESYRVGDRALVRYDPASPATSVWIGREEIVGQV